MGKKKKSREWNSEDHSIPTASLFGVFRFVPLKNRIVVILGLFLSSVLELFGYAIIIPLLATISGNTENLSGKKEIISHAINGFMGFFHLPVNIATMAAGVALGLALKSGMTIMVMLYVGRIMSDITSSVRLTIIRNLLDVRWGYFARQRLGRILNGVGMETAAIGEYFYNAAYMIALFMQVAAYIALSFLISWQMSLMSMAIGAFMLVTYGHLVRRTRQAGTAKSKQTRRMMSTFADAIAGIKPIKAMGRQARLTTLFEADNRAVGKAIRAKIVNAEFAGEFQEPILGMIIIVGLYAATKIWGLGLHEQFVMALILMRMISALNQIQKTHSRMGPLKGQFKSAMRLVEETAQSREDWSGSVVPQLRHSIRFDHVGFSYPNKPVLSDVSFEVKAGQITTLAGPSGAGKSTIADLLLRLYHPQEGRILIDDTDLRNVDLLKWRNLIGYVPQDVVLFHDTVFNNVTLGQPEFGEEAVREALSAAGAMDFVDQLAGGLYYVVGERGLLLSGGQRQRIAIARALLHRPSLLILDEATTALDPETERAICNHAIKLCRERGLTILAVSHQPAWRQIAHQVLDVSGGKARLTDRHPNLSIVQGEDK